MTEKTQSTIYKIICNDPDITDCYVGSTTNFKKRMANHKDAIHNYKSRKHKYKLYEFIRNHGGWDNWRPVEIITHNCIDKLEVALHERFYIDALKPSLNTQIPLRTRKEWIECNRDKINDLANNYYHKNKEVCLASQKKWREANREKLKIDKKNYYDKNKERILQKKREQYALSKQTNPPLSV